MARKTKTGEKLSGPFEKFMKDFPEVFQGYDAMGTAAHAGGPLDARTRELVKLGMAIGARLRGATHSHVHKALAAGMTAKEIRHRPRHLHARAPHHRNSLDLGGRWAERKTPTLISMSRATACSPRSCSEGKESEEGITRDCTSIGPPMA